MSGLINFGGQSAPDPTNAFMSGFQNARALRQQVLTENALARYATNPDDPEARQALMFANPQLGLGLQREERMDRVQTEALGLRRQEQAQQIEAAQMKEAREAVGQAALGILRLPVDQRGIAFDQQIDLLAQRFPGLAKYKGRYSPELLDAALAEAGMMDKAIELTSPRYQAIVPGGELRNTNPFAPTQMGAVAGPQPGAIEDGYRFRGGNPADPNSWEPVGGASQPGSQTFP